MPGVCDAVVLVAGLHWFPSCFQLSLIISIQAPYVCWKKSAVGAALAVETSKRSRPRLFSEKKRDRERERGSGSKSSISLPHDI